MAKARASIGEFEARFAAELAASQAEGRSFVAARIVEYLMAGGLARSTAHKKVADALKAHEDPGGVDDMVGDIMPPLYVPPPPPKLPAKELDPKSVTEARGVVAEVTPRIRAATRLVTAGTSSPLAVMDMLTRMFSRVELATMHALRTDPETGEEKVYNAKLLLQSLEVNRRCIETASDLASKLRQIESVDRFLMAVIVEIEHMDPDAAARLRERLDVLMHTLLPPGQR